MTYDLPPILAAQCCCHLVRDGPKSAASTDRRGQSQICTRGNKEFLEETDGIEEQEFLCRRVARRPRDGCSEWRSRQRLGCQGRIRPQGLGGRRARLRQHALQSAEADYLGQRRQASAGL